MSLTTSAAPPVFYRYNPDALLRASAAVEKQGAGELKVPLAALREEARVAVGFAPVSVTGKAVPPPSGDPKDYQSIATYAWPDPQRENGIPWIEIDGKRNPECDRYDQKPLQQLSHAVSTLALSAFLFGNRAHGRHAVRLLRHWYLDPVTGMNPNLNFAQHFPGVCDGRPWGIIDHSLYATVLLESADLLAWTGDMSMEEKQRFREFFTQLLDWLQSHPHALAITCFHNNHGVYFDQFVARIALFIGQPAVARAVLARVPHKIREQIAGDGAQPREMKRANALIYSAMNLRGFLQLSVMAARLGIDLDSPATPEGRSLRGGVRFLCELVTGKREAEYREHAEWRPHVATLLAMAGYRFDDANLLETAAATDPGLAAHRVHLTHSATP